MSDRMIPQLLLEKYILDEADSGERRLVEEAAARNPEIQQQIEDLKNSNEEILQVYSPQYMAGRIQNALEKDLPVKAEKKKSSFNLKLFRIFAGATMALVIAGLFIFTPKSSPVNYPGSEVIFLKGEAGLKIYKESGDTPVLLDNNSLVSDFETIQLSYSSGNYSYGAIISIDGRGTVTLHYPDSYDDSLKLIKGKEIPLEYSYELDDAPGFERFFFIASKNEFSLSKIMARARVLAEDTEKAQKVDLSLSREYKQLSILLLKEK